MGRSSVNSEKGLSHVTCAHRTKDIALEPRVIKGIPRCSRLESVSANTFLRAALSLYRRKQHERIAHDRRRGDRTQNKGDKNLQEKSRAATVPSGGGGETNIAAGDGLRTEAVVFFDGV